MTKKLVFSGSSKALQLQQFIEANIYHRQGFVYGAKENRKLQMFLDDLNLPVPDKDGVQRVSNKLVRAINICIKTKTTSLSFTLNYFILNQTGEKNFKLDS